MNGAILMTVGIVCFTAAYFLYSRFIAKAIGVDPKRPTPAHTMGDGVDYVPAHPVVLYGHHFATIAGAGPILGPVLAAQFGWVSVALWIVLGCIFIGAMHDMVTLFLSVRHQGRSIGSVIEDVLGRPGKMIFLMFCFCSVVLLMAVFTGQVADAFIINPAVATSSLLAILEAAVFGICVYRLGWNVFKASFLFVPILFLLVWAGVAFPCDLTALFGVSAAAARNIWIAVLFVYCFAASTLPVWLLLQPRDYLNSYLLYAMLALGLAGIFTACPHINIDAFTVSVTTAAKGTQHLFPLLFVTVACGACSGFHALVASGTTSKQISSEAHIRPIGYGGMLLEGVVALMALLSVAYLSREGLAEGLAGKSPVILFASGLASFCASLGLPAKAAENFMLLSVAAFLMTSVDSCTRLARFIWQEMWSTAASAAPAAPRQSPVARINRNMYVATAVVVAIAAYLLVFNPSMASNLWTMFASANQMLAALTLLTATLWLFKNRLNFWIAALPMCFMIVTSGTAVFQLFLQNLDKWMAKGFAAGGVTAVGSAVLFVLAIVLVVLGALKMRRLLRDRIAK